MHLASRLNRRDLLPTESHAGVAIRIVARVPPDLDVAADPGSGEKKVNSGDLKIGFSQVCELVGNNLFG